MKSLSYLSLLAVRLAQLDDAASTIERTRPVKDSNAVLAAIADDRDETVRLLNLATGDAG